MFEYSIESPLELNYQKPPITWDRYKGYIEYVKNYGSIQPRSQSRSKIDNDISFIVVAHNETGLLLKCLNHIFNQDRDPVEVILVDNGLDDKTRHSLSDYAITYIRTVGNLGPSIGRNIGAALSNTSLLAFIDADGYVPPNYLDIAIRYMRDSNIVALRGKVKPTRDDELRYRKLIGHYDLGADPIPAIIDTEGDAIFRRKDFLSVGGYEDALYGGEGPVLCYRMIEFYGYDLESFYYVPELVLYHDFHRNLEHLYDKYRTYLLLRYKTSLKYPFLAQLVNHYYSLRAKTESVGNDVLDIDIARIIAQRESLQAMFSEELESYYKSNAKRKKARRLISSFSPNFSVIIQTETISHRLDVTIESLLNQTLELIEIIVVYSQSSTDYALKDNRKHPSCVKLHKLEKSSGYYDAINVGIESSTARYILCLREGDRIDPTFLEKAESVFNAYPDIGIVYCNEQTGGNSLIGNSINHAIPADDIASDCFQPICTCFRKDSSIKAGLFDTTLGKYGDWDHWIGIAKQGFQARAIPESLFFPDAKRHEYLFVDDYIHREHIKRLINKNISIYSNLFSDIIASKQVQLESLQNSHAQICALSTNISAAENTALHESDRPESSNIWRVSRAIKFLLLKPASIAFSVLVFCSTIMLIVVGYFLEALAGSSMLLIIFTALFIEILILLIIWLHYNRPSVK